MSAFILEGQRLDHVIAYVGVAMLVLVTIFMVVGFVWWLASSIKRHRDR